jgi:NAD(P)-dependent dehydrogenase (short-subunit alcohol dehydrogenase family)
VIETAQLEDVVSRPLAGRRALVTGGSRGIGAGILRRLADGVPVAFTYRESKEAANDLEQEIISAGGQAFAIQADSESADAVRGALTATVDRFDELDVLVNNAGTSHRAPIEGFPLISPKGARSSAGSSPARAGTSMVASLFNPRACLPFGSRLDSYLDSYLNPRYGSHQ